MDTKEKRRLKAIERSRKASMKLKTKERTASDIERLKRYNIRKLLFLKFSIDPDGFVQVWQGGGV